MYSRSTFKIYFKNLNSLRFIAALLVILSHLEYLKKIFGFRNYTRFRFFEIAGNLGVICFFVLSGFLISWLLLAEKNEFGKVHTGNFYVRRILRIWPLYYLIIVLGFFVFPRFSFFSFPGYSTPPGETAQLFMYLFLIPNISAVFFTPLPYIGQLWSIGVEEQFYLIWPWFISKVHKPLKSIIIFLILWWMLKAILIISGTQNEWLTGFISFIHISTYDSLLIGAMGAYIIRNNYFKRMIYFLFSKPFQIIFYPILALLIVTGFYFPYTNTQVYSFLFLILILNLAVNPNCILSIENKTLSYLGKISYGLYIYHIATIVIALRLAKLLSITNYFAILVLSLTTTILVSSISYHLFEKPFLSLKDRFTFIQSG